MIASSGIALNEGQRKYCYRNANAFKPFLFLDRQEFQKQAEKVFMIEYSINPLQDLILNIKCHLSIFLECISVL